MKATKSILNIQSILKDFSGLAEARKSYTLRTRLVFIFCGVTIAMVLFFAHSVVNNAMNKILVVAVIMIFVVLCLATTAWTEPMWFCTALVLFKLTTT